MLTLEQIEIIFGTLERLQCKVFKGIQVQQKTLTNFQHYRKVTSFIARC